MLLSSYVPCRLWCSRPSIQSIFVIWLVFARLKHHCQFRFVGYRNWINLRLFLWKYRWKVESITERISPCTFLHEIKSDPSTFDKPGLLRLYYWPSVPVFNLLPATLSLNLRPKQLVDQSAAASKINSNDLSYGIRELEVNEKWRKVARNTYLCNTHRRQWKIMPLCQFLLTDSAFECDHLPIEKTRRILTSYLSEVTFADEDDFGLRLPKRNMPDGFQLSHMRCCERSLYGFMPGFTIVLSKEISRDMKRASFRVSVSNLKNCFFFSLNILVMNILF